MERSARRGPPERNAAADRFRRAPFTLAAYTIEADRAATIADQDLHVHRHRRLGRLMGRLARSVTLYLNAQIDPGHRRCNCSTVGPAAWGRTIIIVRLPHTRSVIDGLRPDVPVIHFATGNPALLPLLGEAFGKKKRPAVVGVDWRIRLDDAWRMIGPERPFKAISIRPCYWPRRMKFAIA